MGEFVDGILHAAYILQLAARMAMHQLEAVFHAARLQRCQQLQNLGDEQAELRFLAGRVAPAPGALAGQLDAHAEARTHAVGVGVAQDQRQFVEILDHRNDGAPELGGENDGLDVARILEAIADDQPVAGRLGDRHDRQQFRLGAHLQAEAKLLAVAVHLVDDQALLVDLDREHRAVAVAVLVLDDGAREGIVQMAEPVREDVRESHHDGRRQIARLQTLHHLQQVDFVRGGGVGAHDHVAGFVDREIARTPGGHVVQFQRVGHFPGAVAAAWRRILLSHPLSASWSFPLRPAR